MGRQGPVPQLPHMAFSHVCKRREGGFGKWLPDGLSEDADTPIATTPRPGTNRSKHAEGHQRTQAEPHQGTPTESPHNTSGIPPKHVGGKPPRAKARRWKATGALW